jgi:hypothetical protein
MNLVFKLEGVICNHEDKLLYKHCKPLINAVEFMQWAKKQGHHLTIWCERENDMQTKIITEQWLEMNQVPYDRLLFDRPMAPIFVDETPSNAKYYRAWGDNQIVDMLFEEWKNEASQ